MRFALYLSLLSVLASCARSTETPPATLTVLNGRIWTGNPESPRAEALLVADEEILAVGSNADIERIVGDARVIDATGRFVTPGFIDSHVHFLDGHMARANSLALETAGVTRDTEEVEGGTIELVDAVMPPTSRPRSSAAGSPTKTPEATKGRSPHERLRAIPPVRRQSQKSR